MANGLTCEGMIANGWIEVFDGETVSPKLESDQYFVRKGTVKIVDQSGGYFEARGNSTVNSVNQTNGNCFASENATINFLDSMGGWGIGFDNSTINVCFSLKKSQFHGFVNQNATLNITGQNGECFTSHDNATINSTGQIDGRCIGYDNSTINSKGCVGGRQIVYDNAVLNIIDQEARTA
jgi:hypothetical protein